VGTVSLPAAVEEALREPAIRIAREIEDLEPTVARLLPVEGRANVDAMDPNALDQALHSAWSIVYNKSRRHVGNPDEAEEIAHEVFLRVLLKISGGSVASPGEGKRTAELVQVAQNLFADQWRSKTRHADAEGWYSEVRSTTLDLPEERLIKTDERADAHAAVEQLRPAQRQVLRLRIYEHLSVEEVAFLMGRSPEWVRQTQHRALRALRDRMGGSGRPGLIGSEELEFRELRARTLGAIPDEIWSEAETGFGDPALVST
jgi:RNA polymerase sigma-70 factor (ECF subfamily)